MYQSRPATLVVCLIEANCKILGDQAATCTSTTSQIRNILNKLNIIPFLG